MAMMVYTVDALHISVYLSKLNYNNNYSQIFYYCSLDSYEVYVHV